MPSIFLSREGGTPRNRILSFLVISSEFDYSIKDIARFSKVGYTTTKKVHKDLVKNKWLAHTRDVGKAKMYKLNLKSSKVRKFIDFYWSVVEEGTPRVAAKQYSHSGSVAAHASAKTI